MATCTKRWLQYLGWIQSTCCSNQVVIVEGRIIGIAAEIADRFKEDSTSSSANTTNIFPVDKDGLWINGRVSYRFEKNQKQDGTFEPMFRREHEYMIRDAMKKIEQQVPCIEFMRDQLSISTSSRWAWRRVRDIQEIRQKKMTDPLDLSGAH